MAPRRDIASLAAFIAFVPLLCIQSCSIDVPLEGKRCDRDSRCVEGFRCDTDIKRCIVPCNVTLTPSELTAVWSTPNSIDYTWKLDGAGTFLRHELWVAVNEDDLADRVGTARRFTAETNPELEILDPAEGPPTALLRDLKPGTNYWARVYAIDSTECAVGSNVIGHETAAEVGGFVSIFEDELPSHSSTAPSQGIAIEDGKLVYTPDDDPECKPMNGSDGQCGQPVRIQDLAMQINQVLESRGIPREEFANSFLEVRLTNRGAKRSRFAKFSLWFDPFTGCGAPEQYFYMDRLTLPADDLYHVFQIPLAHLIRGTDGVPLKFAEFDTTARGKLLCEVGVGAQWNKMGQVRVDHMKIRYP